MTMSAQHPFITVEEYLRLEQGSTEKHEYLDGEILIMAGGSYHHSLITSNTIRALGNALAGKACQVLDSNLRVKIPRSSLYTYPDLSVLCGAPQFDPSDPSRGTIMNPTLIVEVLSKSTEGYDRGEKFTRYRMLDSLQEYMLISQDSARVDLFLRQEEGAWRFSAFAGLDEKVRLASISLELALADIYRGVMFGDEAPAGENA